MIHIERPVSGDPARGVRSIKALEIGDWNQYFMVINRNKKSLAIDLRKKEHVPWPLAVTFQVRDVRRPGVNKRIVNVRDRPTESQRFQVGNQSLSDGG